MTLLDDPRVPQADAVRLELLRHFGYWCTQNHRRHKGYLPYCRQAPVLIDRFLARGWTLPPLGVAVQLRDMASIDQYLSGSLSIQVAATVLQGPGIIHTLCTGQPGPASMAGPLLSLANTLLPLNQESLPCPIPCSAPYNTPPNRICSTWNRPNVTVES